MKVDIKSLSETSKIQLVESRWNSSYEVWDKIKRITTVNTGIYENKPAWLQTVPHKRQGSTVQANRVFVNMEAVINSLIANPPGVNVLPGRQTEASQDFARKLEKYFRKKYLDLNTKETFRMGLRNLYFSRMIVIKPFWNPAINDFDFRSVDPNKIRFGKYAKKEQETEFIIEEIEDNLCALVERFPEKKKELMAKFGITDEEQLYIKNPDVKYKEAWISDYVVFKLENIILDCIKNPYWDWDGIYVTEEEEAQLSEAEGEEKRQMMQTIKLDQSNRQPVVVEEKGMIAKAVDGVKSMFSGEEEVNEGYEDTPTNYKPYYYNFFDTPRKPYIFATIFNNENSPIGRTDMITLSAELQRGIDKRKMDIDENCEMVNGILKVDSGVMPKQDAQRIRFETKGIIWGKDVKNGVTREVGSALPQMVFDDMIDSRNEIDNIMAATSAFKGERQGQETKAGRLALIQQSYLRLNELVQVVDYVSHEMFNWGMQLAKTRYTEAHYVKWMGKEEGQEMIEVIQDDFEDGQEITIIAGKTLPVDDEFKFEQAQNDVKEGYISPVDYLEIANYDNPKELSRNAVLYQQNPAEAVGLAPDEVPLPAQPGELQPDQAAAMMQEGLVPSMQVGELQPTA